MGLGDQAEEAAIAIEAPGPLRSSLSPQTMRKDRRVSRRSCRGCRKQAGRSAATCASTSAGVRAMPTVSVRKRRNWSRLRRTPSWPVASRSLRPCCRRPAACRLYPVGAGLVASMARPGGNATGFTVFEYAIGGKWVELLKEIAPAVTRVAALRDAASTSGIGLMGAMRSTASSFGMDLSPVGVGDASEIERAIAAFARAANGGLIVQPSTSAIVHRELIITLAARHRLPAVYGQGSLSTPAA
jgi:ABC transporter substrate binding protein